MKLINVLSVFAIVALGLTFSAQPVHAEKNKTEASSKKKQTRAEFNESLFKKYKAFKLEQKDLQIQFINKQFNLDLENEKALNELRNKINPAAGEKNKEINALIEKKGKEFQEKNKKDSEEFYIKKMAEKGKAYYENSSKLSKEFEATQQQLAPPVQPQGQQAPPPKK